MDDEAVALLAASCGGLPRTLSRAAGLALDLALAAESDLVDVEAVLEALGRLGLEPADAETDDLLHTCLTAQPLHADTAGGKAGGGPAKGDDEAAGPPPKQKASRRRSA